jgi:bacillithiol system protein YtxJ
MRSKGAEQETEFVPLTDANALEELFALSHTEPVILFKHSSTCPISSAAYGEMSRYAGRVALVVVQRARDVSREIEARTGVRHESPQAIIIRNGQAVWNASHWNVRADAVERAAREHQ